MFKDDLANGYGKLIGNGFIYEGNFLNGMKSGKGIIILII